MKIEAAARLNSARIVPPFEDPNMETDKGIQQDLYRKTPKDSKTVSTTDRNTSLVVCEYDSGYKIGIKVKNKFVGLIHLRKVHDGYTLDSYLSKQHRGKGLAVMVYKWVLDHGFTLVAIEQTRMSNDLWRRLAQEYTLKAIKGTKVLRDKSALSVIDNPEYKITLSKR